MSNEVLADIDNMSNDKVMAMLGQDVESGGSSLSRLSINYDTEDSEGNLIKRVVYKIDSQKHCLVFA